MLGLMLISGLAVAGEPAAALRSITAQVPALEGVRVSGEDGVVVLEGTVTDAGARQRLLAAAEALEGVVYVDDQLDRSGLPAADSAALAEQLQQVFASVEELSGVSVAAAGGVVHLTGAVATASARQQAHELAAGLDGVLYVDDDTTLTSGLSERLSPAIERARGQWSALIGALPLVGVGAIIMLISVLLSRWASSSRWLLRRLDDRPLLQSVLRRSLRLSILMIGALSVLELLQLTALVGAILGTAGVAGIAVGFAFKDIVENYLATLLLSFRQPFHKGDVIELSGVTGSVARMTSRDTVLLTFDGNHVRIPNAQVFRSVLTNYTTNPRRRFDFTVGVGTEDNLIEARRLGIQTMLSVEGVLEDPAPFMLIDELGDSNVLCHFYVWVDQRESDRSAVRSECIRRIKVAYLRDGFDLPEPIYRLHVKRGSAPIDTSDEPLEADHDEHHGAPQQQRLQQLADEASQSDEADLLR